MADLALVTAGVMHVVDANPHSQITTVANAALVAGQICSLVAATGKAQLADADVETLAGQLWMATRNCAAGEAITLSRDCVVAGFDLSSINPGGVAVYLSNTAGAMADAAASPGTSIVVGRTMPVFANGATADRLLHFCPANT